MKAVPLPEIASRSGKARIRAALESGIPVDERDQKGRTALFRTARLGKSDRVKLLLEFHANPNATDDRGEAPLQAAARYGYEECVALLLKAGAEIDYCPDVELTNYSESALCSAVRKGHQRVVSLLLNAGASPNASTAAKSFPLIAAASRGDAATCRRLVEAGADTNQRDEFGSTPLHHGVRSRSVETIRELLGLGADVDAKNDDGVTPVCEATSTYQSVPLLAALLKAKPDLSICSPPFNRTPLEEAIEFELDEIADLLRAAGAKEPAPITKNDSLHVEIGVEEQDRALAEELSREKVPHLIKKFGWEASRCHWTILEKCTSPIPLARIAYFARGWWNRPAGEELKDGPDVLGESYGAAVDRFVSLGLLRPLDAIELVKLLVTTTDLRKVAKKRGMKLLGKRSEMIQAVFAKATPEDFPDVLRRGPYFVTTPDGEKAVQNCEDCNIGIEERLRGDIIEALLKPDLKQA